MGHAIEDLEKKTKGKEEVRYYPSVSLSDTPYLTVPLCHHLWPSYNSSFIPEQSHRLSVFTRMKSLYADENEKNPNKHLIDESEHLTEWIEYHRQVGVEHFYVYDNDEQPNGKIEKVLHQYIDQGIVTYSWFPMKDCIVDHGDFKGYGSARGQFAAALSMLHRYGKYNDYMAHIDVDEYLVPLNGKSLLPLLHEFPEYDVLGFRPYWMTACDNSVLNSKMMTIEKYNCF